MRTASREAVSTSSHDGREWRREACSSTSPTSATSSLSSPTSVASECVPTWRTASVELDPARPFFEFLTDLLDAWVAYFADHPRERSLHAAASLEVDTDARISVRTVIHRHYLEVLRPLVRDAHARGDLRADCDTDALLSLLLMIFPHLALAPYVRGMDPILGLDEPTPEQPALAVRRLVAVLAAAFSRPQPQTRQPNGSEEVNT